jgi:MHS family proline/betaine transporter-like MFS transporter
LTKERFNGLLCREAKPPSEAVQNIKGRMSCGIGRLGSYALQRDKITHSQWKLIILASLGGGLDYFDFVIYAIFARYISAAFFPNFDPVVSTLLVFMVYAVGFFARPIGGMLLSHFGDRYGRRGVFLFSLMVMSGATFCIGLLPTYGMWGTTASVLLVVVRFLQGMSVGGEVPNAQAYVVETMPKRACFVTGVVQFCVSFGILLATLVNFVLQNTLSQPDLASFGWRIPFLIGGFLGLGALYLRRSLEETPGYQRMGQAVAKSPVSEMLRTRWPALVAGFLSMAVVGGYNGLLFAYMPIYLTNVAGYSPGQVATALNIALAVSSCSVLISAWLGDRLPRHWLLRTGALLLLVFGLPFYDAVVAHSVNLNLLLALAAVAGGFANGVFACVLADLFPTRIRFSGSALGTNLATGIFSGLAPLIVTWLISATGTQVAPAYYLMTCCVIALIASLWLPRYAGQIKAVAEAIGQDDVAARPGYIAFEEAASRG